ncbi:thiS: thiamine biosynthesis protein ThiS [Rubrobacter radiotolerans]|uniref:Thiazole synthase n=1 Tax=Rubrobacter radiotolerans TaxID=42256 RepID=A0A023X1C5_RUBRA|nr:sulfur carrier protein ThiS [Rubrobacter radiotolerans]AHY45869.1 thiS: thiamine biosynthesis protein ThiS [Rubrobacter radiotolerans]SMC03419.1 thiazole-phosphate synthase [Rubrobacter radiotolerans DSM 5868]
MQLTVNREPVEVEEKDPTVRTLVAARDLPHEAIVVALNGEVVRREEWDTTAVRAGDEVEIVHAVAGGEGDDVLRIAGVPFESRLFTGTGKYPDHAVMNAALDASGTEMVTVAVRYMDLDGERSILQDLDLSRYRLLPNTAGAKTAEQAVRMARLAREATGTNWVKLEVIGDDKTLWPDTEATVAATRTLVDEDFVVLPYTSTDLVAAVRLEEAGAATVMPLASPIGSGQGLPDWASISRIVERITSVPVVVDAGIGVPSDASRAMELGADAVLVNTAIAKADDPVAMARAMRLGTEAGRLSYLAGRMPVSPYAVASSPTAGVPS